MYANQEQILSVGVKDPDTISQDIICYEIDINN